MRLMEACFKEMNLDKRLSLMISRFCGKHHDLSPVNQLVMVTVCVSLVHVC